MKKTLALGSMLVIGAGLAYATDQTILGNSLLLKNPSTPAKRKIIGKAKELGSSNTILGNPTLSGASLTVSASGGTPSTQMYALPQNISGITGKPFWSGDAVKGFKYKDPKGEQGPVKVAQIKKAASGVFSIKTVIVGKLGLVTVVPPNPGTGGCILLSLTGGDTYSVSFAPGTGAQLTNKGSILFKAKKPTGEGTCVVGPTTTSTTAAPPTTTTSTTTVAPPTTTPTTSTTSSTTTTTTLYGSPSRAFVDRVMGLLD